MLFIRTLHSTAFLYNSFGSFHVSVHPWECVVLVISVKTACLGEMSRTVGEKIGEMVMEQNLSSIIDMIANAPFVFLLLLTASLR